MRWRLFPIGVGLASFSTIALELMLTRIFSVTMYYHFAFMVISIAMLGLSVSGVAIYLFPGLFRDRRAPALASLFMLLFCGLCVWTLRTALANPISLAHWRSNLGTLGLLYLTAGLTLLSSGFAISLAIASAKERIGMVYAFDLVGAALGCVFVIPTVSGFGAPGAILACAAVGAIAALLFALSAGDTASLPVKATLAGASAVAALVLLGLAPGENTAHRFGIARNPEKFLGRRAVEFEKWNSFSQITVTPAGPDHKWIFIDADAATRLWSGAIARDGYQAPRRFGEVRVAALVYSIRHERPALIIGPGGGTDITSALSHGVPRVVGVEVNPIIVNDVVRGRYAGFDGDLYRDPRVNVVVDEGRSYIRRSGEQYGSIQATLVDTWAASSSGAFTLSENNIYTVEAFEEFLNHLAPGGVLAVTRWYDPSNPKEFLRLVALGREALERRGVDPKTIYQHFVLATDGERRGTLLLDRDAFTTADLDGLADKAVEGKLQLLFTPQPTKHPFERDAFIDSYLRAPDGAAFLAKLPYNAAPVTDDRPFFFYTLHRGEMLSILGHLSQLDLRNLGVAILLMLLILSAALTLVLVVAPLLVFERRSLDSDRSRKLRVLGYFLCLGLGFILVEIGFMQRFVLFLGHPMYSLAVILASLLAASGAGSALSDWGSRRYGLRGYVRRAIGLLAGLLAIYALVLTPLFHALLGIPLAARIVIAVVLVSAPGLLMGALLPSGVRMANELGRGTVAWAWGLNGAASVVGSILAMALSMNFGFTLSLFVGIGVYLCGMLLLTGAARATASATQPG
jgi:hypothetical protein